MSRSSLLKKERQQLLIKRIKDDPFLTDEEIANMLSVSVPTIRLDRLELGIPEVRERIKNVAAENYKKVKSLDSNEIVGDALIELGKSAISPRDHRGYDFRKDKNSARPFYLFPGRIPAIAVIDAQVALVGVANIKYKTPVYAGSKLLARAEVKRTRGNSHIVWVMIAEKQVEVFRGKFILVALEKV